LAWTYSLVLASQVLDGLKDWDKARLAVVACKWRCVTTALRWTWIATGSTGVMTY